jgi:hypothetical protein
LPDGLDETYERILREIKKPNQEHAHRLLQCLVVAVRPLTVEELAEVLAFDFDSEGVPELKLDWRWEDQEEAIMSACSNLVIIVKDKDSRIVQFSHFSVKEFLTAKRLAEPIRDVSRYHIRLDSAHTILVRACIGILLRFESISLYEAEDSPLFSYAANYWNPHARFENVSSHVKEGIRCLFDADKPYFGAWLRNYRPVIGDFLSTMWPGIQQAGIHRVVPLHYVAFFGYRDAAEIIISEHPEQINARGMRGVTPLHAAAITGHTDILALLLKHGANVDARDGMVQTPLHRASLEGKLEAGRYLLDHGADINPRARRNLTPLCAAVLHGHVEVARMLLERGAAMDVRPEMPETGKTLLTTVISLGRTQSVRLLLEYGEDVNERDRLGRSPSQWASICNQQDILELLSEYGAESVE